MKFVTLLLGSLFLIVLYIEDVDSNCKPDEHIPRCMPCYGTCKEMRTRITKCPRVCQYKHKCYCKDHKLKNARGKCVPKSACP
ncbi:unnamed protein product [Callosobruchus maculatus]|uniref:TIL domain-containing protein n=1 Tax=Callosobruchus maculatus TaxID=64391 RepID=A0A653D6C9_CALMS|nr:unnamed protein product [Callosobruchus maculatus]